MTNEAPRASARGICGKAKRSCAEANPPSLYARGAHAAQAPALRERLRCASYGVVACRHSSPCFRTGHPGEGE